MGMREMERSALRGFWVVGMGMREAGRRYTKSNTGNEMGGVIAVGRLIIVVRRIGGILLMGFTTGGDDFECIE
jgi:hypothetical protein